MSWEFGLGLLATPKLLHSAKQEPMIPPKIVNLGKEVIDARVERMMIESEASLNM